MRNRPLLFVLIFVLIMIVFATIVSIVFICEFTDSNDGDVDKHAKTWSSKLASRTMDNQADPGEPSQPGDDMFVIATMTTTPNRLVEHVGLKITLISLFNQTRPFDEIHLNIPHHYKKTGEPYVIPDWLDAIATTHPQLKIFRVDDKGPATKFLSTLERCESNSGTSTNQSIRLYICDDDYIYKSSTLAILLEYAIQYPGGAYGSRGAIIDNLIKGEPEYSWTYVYSGKRNMPRFIYKGVHARGITTGSTITLNGFTGDAVPVDLLYGSGGILLDPTLIKLSEFDYTVLPKEAFYVDDIVIAGILARHRIDRFVCQRLPPPVQTIAQGILQSGNEHSLCRTDNKSSRNNFVTIQYFEKDLKDSYKVTWVGI